MGKNIILKLMAQMLIVISIFVGYNVIFVEPIQVNAISPEDKIAQIENTLDFWGNKETLSSVPDIEYTITGIHIKMTEHRLNTIKTISDCQSLAQQVLTEFQQKNGVVFKRNLNSVMNEIYFHVQSEKEARIKNLVSIHEHTKIIDMEQSEDYWEDLMTPYTTDALCGSNLSTEYTAFMLKYYK